MFRPFVQRKVFYASAQWFSSKSCLFASGCPLKTHGGLGTAIAFLMIVPLIQASPTIYDLAEDWSFATNPHGVWSYNEGANPLPLQNPWSPSDPNSPPG